MVYDRQNSATYLAIQLAKGLTRSLQQRVVALGFSAGQFPVLLELWGEDGLTQRQLLERIDIEQATMANTLSRMERDGLIERKSHPIDKRAQLIHLTEKAKELERQAIDAAISAEEALLGGFRRFERELMLEYIRQAIENGRDP